MVYLTKGGFWLTLSQVISSSSVLILAIAFANFLPKETFGIYKYILSIAAIISVFSLTGMNTAVTQAVARGYEGVLKKSFWIQIKWGLIMFAIGLAGSAYYFIHDNQTLAISFLIIGSFSVVLNSANTYSAFISGKKDFKSLSIYSISSVIFTSSILLLTMLLTKKPVPLILAYFISNTIATLFFYILTIKHFNPNHNYEQETISYGKHLSLINIPGVILSYFDNLLIFHFLGAADLAIYAIAIAPAEQIKGVFKNVINLALPKFSERSSSEIKENINHKVIVSGLILAIIVILYIVAAPLIFKIFFPKYDQSIFYSQIYALSAIAAVSLLPYSAIQSQMAKKQLYYINIFNPIIQIIIFAVFIYYWGIMGAVIGRIISRILNLFLSLIFLKKI